MYTYLDTALLCIVAIATTVSAGCMVLVAIGAIHPAPRK